MEWPKQGELNGIEKRGWRAKVWISLALLLVAALSFEAGWLKRSLGETELLLITSPVTLPAPALPERVAETASPPLLSQAPDESSVPKTTTCTFVGSKNSNKYHALTSRCAKQIKPANIVCFATVEAAAAKGYLPGCLD